MGSRTDRSDIADVQLCEIGALGVRSADVWTPLRGERVAAVVAMLSMAGGAGVRTDALLDAGWPEPARPSTARRSLANVVARLRAQFGPTFVETTGTGYRLGAEVGSDRAQLLEAAAAVMDDDLDGDPGLVSQIDRALRLWRGEPWVDVSIDEVEADRARLHAARVRLLQRAARTLAHQQRFGEAVDRFEEVMLTDAADESDWYGLARSLAALGRRADALERIQQARRAQGVHAGT